MLATFLTSSRPSTAGIPDLGAVGFRVHRSLRRVPVAAGTLHPSLATGLQGVSRLSDIDRRDLLVVPNPAAPDALERRLLLAVLRASMPAVLAWQLWLVPI
jgi:hypothetical protein